MTKESYSLSIPSYFSPLFTYFFSFILSFFLPLPTALLQPKKFGAAVISFFTRRPEPPHRNNNISSINPTNHLVGVVPSNMVAPDAPGQGLGWMAGGVSRGSQSPPRPRGDPRRNSRQPGIPSSPPLIGGGGGTTPPEGGGDDRSVFSLGRMPSLGRRRSQQTAVVDVWQQRFVLDMEEAEMWQRELIKFYRDETKEKKADGGGTGAGTGGGAGVGVGVHPVPPSNDRSVP